MRGAIHWVAPEVLRPSVPGVAHPNVVVSEDLFNDSRIPTVVVCGLTTRLSRTSEPGSVLLEEGEGGLSQRSVVLASQICTVDKADLGARIGMLDPVRVEAILAALRFVQRLTRR
ncbi:MAG: type II toxin-antitoxin system PemK/MazF family toxin [Myxococcota bacterium]